MSLINDALKRASQSDRNRPRPTETHVAMRPAAERRNGALSLWLGTGIVLALGLAGLFFWQWWNVSHAPVPAKVETAAAVAPKPAPAPPPVLHESVPAPTPEPAPPPPAKPVAEAWPTNLKLNGIFFSKANARAIINGKTVVVGDEIDGIRVTKIEHSQVTVEWNGQVKELIIE
jgi:ribosome-associated protein YbcJ (S4-like RNA binding protein)